MHFSRRTEWGTGENPWAEALGAARVSGRDLIDLTISNPTQCGLGPASSQVLSPLSDAAALTYRPDALGLLSARAAVRTYLQDGKADVPVDQICLTTSTSEAYSFLFRLLCDPGDEVLVARPSYPLFDLLAGIDDVVLRPYPLLYDPGAGGRWSIDLYALERALTARTRALIVVHPNNPTGNLVTGEEREALRTLCGARGIALIVDEVFLDFPIGDAVQDAVSFAAQPSACMSFILSGVSKICALPQMKLSWIAAVGQEAMVAEAMRRLEIISDTFLSVNAPTQLALPHWLADREVTQTAIRKRLTQNLATLDKRLSGTMAGRLPIQGGWTVVLRVPAAVEGEAFAFAAMQRGVVVQPGALYGLSGGHCVLSLLTPPDLWAHGLALLPID